MYTRRSILVAGLCVTVASHISGAASAQANSMTPAYILGAAAITRVYGDGQRLVAVALTHDRDVDSSALEPSLYAVEGRVITKVYSNTKAELAAGSVSGPVIIIELSPDDAAAKLFVTDGRSARRLPAATTINILPTVKPAETSPSETSGPPDTNSLPRSAATDMAINLIVDDFEQASFSDAQTGDVLAYNLRAPRARDPDRPLPLVLFMHDAGNTSTVVDTTLVQGLGAVSWAEAPEQVIVLAPQYASQVVDDASKATSLLDTTFHLLEQIIKEHNVDRNRLYLTGQSGGGMMSIAMLIKEPAKFAAAFLVACQWDPALVAPLARQKLWVMVAKGDAKAFPGQNAIMEVVTAEGVKHSSAMWDGTLPASEFEPLVAAQLAEHAPINYTVLKKGTVVPAGQEDTPGANHINTWRIAYTIAGIRAWILQQRRSD